MVVPINGPALQSTSAPARPELPMSIAPGGSFDVGLASARQFVWNNGMARHLNEKLGRDLQNIRTAFLSAQLDRFLTPMDRLTAALQDCSLMGEDGDPVLRYSVAQLEKLDANQFCNLFVLAAQSYESAFNAYQINLGNLIPPNLTERVNIRVAQAAYIEGTNATSIQDWSIFQMAAEAERYCGPYSPRITTGLPTLDAALDGVRGLNFIAGDKGIGKTALLVSIAYSALNENQDTTVLFYSLDMPKSRIYERFICRASEVDYRCLRDINLPPETRDRLLRGDEHLRSNILPRLRVQERRLNPSRHQSSQNLDLDTVLAHIDELLKASKKHSVLLIFDLFQRIDIQRRACSAEGDEIVVDLSEVDKDHARLDMFKRIQEASRFSNRPYGFPILASSEIRKGDLGKRVLSGDDLLGSSRLASDADTILLLSTGDQEQCADDRCVSLNLRIVKGRDGVNRCEVPLWFQHARTKFFDADPAKSTAASTGRTRRQIPRPTNGGR